MARGARLRLSVCSSVLVVLACGSSSGSPGSSGGTPPSPGGTSSSTSTSGAGSVSSSGGVAFGSGGSESSGGAPQPSRAGAGGATVAHTGGASSRGGSASSGGSLTAGESPSRGGASQVGGALHSGGTLHSGGSASTAGSGSSGGVYVVERDPNAPGILIHVENRCPFDLWIRGAGSGAVLQPENARLSTGQAQDYLAPDQWSAARVTAYGEAPNAQGQPQHELDKVEMTLGKKIINYNITYVDWLALPVELRGIGSGSDCRVVGCYASVADVAARCPAGLMSGERCLSAGNFCSRSENQSSAFCTALDEKIAACAGDPKSFPGCEGAQGAKTPEAYGCSGFFAQSPKWCAALNRGMLEAPDDGDITKYYRQPPFNAYAKWVHDVCPGIYAFPYDDYGKTNESGFHACTGGTQLNITFCPNG